MELLLSKTQNTLNNWRILLVPSFLYVFVGVLAFAASYENYPVLGEIFGFTLLISGILELIFLFRIKTKAVSPEGAMIAAILDLLMAFLLLANPDAILFFLPFYFGIWILLRGLVTVIFSVRTKLYGRFDWVWLLLFGLATLNFFVLLLLFQMSFTDTLNPSQITGLAFMTAGAFRLFLTFDIKMLHGFHNKCRQIGVSSK